MLDISLIINMVWIINDNDYIRTVSSITSIFFFLSLSLIYYLLFLVNKIASSSLARLFIPYIQNASYDQDFNKLHTVFWKRARRLASSNINKFQNTTSFVISRHPFTRIASACRNKFQIDTRIQETFIRKYSAAICVAARGEWNEGDQDPSFEEFVKYLIKTKVEKMDGHWRSVNMLCR